MVFKAYTIPILINSATRIVHRGVLVYNGRRWLQYVYKKHAEKEA